MNRLRHVGLLTMLILVPCLLTACSITGMQNVGRTVRGSGYVVEEYRAVNGVSGVSLATIGHLIIEVGDTESLRIEAEENLMEWIETKVRNGELIIKNRDNTNLKSTKPVNYYLTVKGLDAIRTSSIGDVEAPDMRAGRFSITVASTGGIEMGNLEADTLIAKLVSTGNVRMGMLNTRTLKADISSTGSLYIIGGEIESQDVTLNSSGNYEAQDLLSHNAEMTIRSSGSAIIWVSSYLKARLNSSGNLRYLGNPRVDATTSSSGEVIHLNR